MVDFDAAVAAVQDPNADPVFLAKIAYENPEFGANVVANPRAYPGLKRWVAQFGDERARQQLVAMGWPVPQEGVMRRNTETTPEQAQQSLTQAQYQQPQQASEAQYQMQYQPPAADQYQSESFMEASASNMASEAPELHPFLARNPNIYPDLLDWLAGLNDSAVNAAIRLRQ